MKRAPALIRAIVRGLKLKRADGQGELDRDQAAFGAKAGGRIRAGAVSGRSEQAAGRILARRRAQGISHPVIRLLLGMLVAPMVVLWTSERAARVDSSQGTIPAGTSPIAVAVNPVTNKIYVANQTSNNVTIIDGSTNATATVAAGSGPRAVAVNPATNKIYVANGSSNNVTVIDGSTNTTATVAAGTLPIAVAVNPVTNKIYVANQTSNNVTVIDGSTNATATVAAGSGPRAVAVNPVTNKIYVANGSSNNVTVIDGSTNTTATVAAGTLPVAIAVNPITNKIYVTNFNSVNVTVIDGSTNTTTTVAAGASPQAVAVNPVTNKIYVANGGSANVTVIDGSNNTTTTVAAGTFPVAVAVNPVTNKIYVANRNSANVTVIDGSNNTTTTVAAGTLPIAVAVNPVTNKIYVANGSSNNVTVIDGSDNTTATVAAGSGPRAVAVNPVTYKIYVANLSSPNVTVIDGSDNTTTTIAAGAGPRAVAVNSVTNKIYVANSGSNNVTVIDGSTNTTATVAAGSGPVAVAVNPVTNKIYVANFGANVTVIDGSTNTTATVAAGSAPTAVAVNPVTNKIYVANQNSANVTVIDGSNNTTTTVAAGTFPATAAVNPVTNKIYVANSGSANVTVIDGSTNTTATVAAGTSPQAVAVNPATNKIYVANFTGASVTVIDGSTNTTATVAAGTSPQAVAVNPVTNKIYVANVNSANVTVIDGSNNTTTTVAAGSGPRAVAVNPVTNKIYVANGSSANVTVITPVATQAIPLTVAIAPLPNNLASSPTPTFNFTATSAFTPTAPPVTQIYYQVDTWTGPWLKASPQGSAASGQTPALQLGLHIIYAFAVDGQDATSVNPTPNSSPLIGQISAYPFQVTAPTTLRVASNPNPSLAGQPVALFASVTASTSGAISGGTVQFKDGPANLGSPVAVTNGIAALVTSSLAVGAHTITADYSGDDTFPSTTSINSVNQNVTDTATWTGATSSDWNTGSNWSTNLAPTSLTSVTIPASGVTNEPAISAANINVNNLTVAAGRTLTIAASRSLTVNGAATVNGTIAGAGTLSLTGPTLANNGQISLASALFAGGSQSVTGSGAFTGNNTFIVLSGASVILANNFSLVNVYVSSGGSLNISGLVVSLSGAGAALQADGLLTTTGSTIIYNGTAAQSTAPANVTYDNLTIANGAGVSLSANTTVGGELALTGADLNTGAFLLTMPASATSSGTGDVVGSVKRTGFTIGNALSFGNPFNTIRFDGGTPPTEVTVTLDKQAPTTPAPFPQAIARKYTVTPTGGSGYTATLRLHYQDADLNGNSEGTSLNLWRYDGTNWHNEGQTVFDAASNWVEKSGVTQFSAWTMNSTVPTAATVESLQATSYDGGTLIQWQTGFEADNLGFNLYRDEAGKRMRINPQMVAGSALLAGADTVLRAGRSYSFLDDQRLASPERLESQRVAYWLEDVDLNGQSSWHGPFFATFVGGSLPSRRDSPFIGQTTRTPAGITRAVERTVVMQTRKAELIKPPSLANREAVKLWVNHEGWYRVAAAALVQAGLDANANAGSLQLYADGRQVPINVITGKTHKLAAIEFYGRGIDAASTDSRVYWLVSGAQPGLRIPQVKADGYPSAAASFLYTVERKDRTTYFAGLRNGDRENFFGAVIAAQPVEQTLRLANVDETASGPATLEVALQGVTRQPHRIWAYLNGSFVGELFFTGQANLAASFNVSQALLQSGDNDVRLVVQGGPSDISLVDYIRLAYWHRYSADDEALCFTASNREAVTIDGFTDAAIRVFDVTDADSVQELAARVEPRKSGYAVTVTSPAAGERHLLAITDRRASAPAKLTANQPSSLAGSAHAADLVIITTRDFMTAFAPLQLARARQGVKTEMVDIEDLYDEFSFGCKSPQAIKDFLRYAASNWKTKPRYVLLGGDASYDAKNYLGFGDVDLVPTKLIDTALMETASDDWLADFDEDGIAELAIGRLPARTPEEATMMVAKLVAYDQSPPAESVLLVADQNEGFDFEGASQQLRGLVPESLRVEQLNRGQLDAATAKTQLLAAINRGEKLINYAGHGSVNLWRGNLLTNTDAREMTNKDHLPVFVMMTCLNGYFADPAFDSLGEALLKAEGGGAVAAWASSGMTLPEGQALINQQLYRLLLGAEGRALRLGEAVAKAKAAVADVDIRRTWSLLGDPSMKLR